MSEQQITSQDEKKRKKLIKHQRFSKISFILFIISLALYLYMKINFGFVGDFLMGFFFVLYIPYVIYLTLHCLFIIIKYKKVLIYNLIAFALLFIIGTLNYTGFSYTRGHYLSKAEQIDIGLEGYLYTICFDEGWKGEKLKDCPYTLEKLKIEYPQCFTDDRPDDCELYQYKTRDDISFVECILGFAPISAIYSERLTDLSKSLYGRQFYNIYSGVIADADFYQSIDFFKKNFKRRSGE
jgi:hypothetical protein